MHTFLCLFTHSTHTLLSCSLPPHTHLHIPFLPRSICSIKSPFFSLTLTHSPGYTFLSASHTLSLIWTHPYPSKYLLEPIQPQPGAAINTFQSLPPWATPYIPLVTLRLPPPFPSISTVTLRCPLGRSKPRALREWSGALKRIQDARHGSSAAPERSFQNTVLPSSRNCAAEWKALFFMF